MPDVEHEIKGSTLRFPLQERPYEKVFVICERSAKDKWIVRHVRTDIEPALRKVLSDPRCSLIVRMQNNRPTVMWPATLA